MSGAIGRNRGFVLLIVLWTLVLISLIAGHLAANGRVEVRIAGNLSANAAADAARDGAIEAALLNLSGADPKARWAAGGQPHRLDIGASRVELRVVDEAGRINPNLAAPQLLEALLVVTGSDAGTAHRLALAIGQWIGGDATGAAADDAAHEYQAAGLDYVPPLEPLQTIDELARVIGMTPAIVDALRPHMTLYGPAEPDAAAADPVVLAALNYLAQHGQILSPAAGSASPATAGPDTLRITARAQGPGNARSAASAVARLAGAPNGNYVLLAWEDGAP